MESNGGNQRRGLLTAGGVLSIVGAIPQIISGGAFIAASLLQYRHYYKLIDTFFLPFFPDLWQFYIMLGHGSTIGNGIQTRSHWPILGGCLLVVGIVAVIGGISAIRRKRFGLSLAGAICALLSVYEGILAVIFISLGKKEFGASEVD